MTSTPARSSLSPRALFRTFAIAEAFTWAGLISAIILRSLDVVNLVPIAGGVHGFVFLSYVASTIFVWVNQQWKFSLGLTGLALAIFPFATVPFELSVDKRGLLDGGWRLAPGGEQPRGFIEHVQAWVLRHPIVAFALVALLVAAVFLVLLWLGPPVPKG